MTSPLVLLAGCLALSPQGELHSSDARRTPAIDRAALHAAVPFGGAGALMRTVWPLEEDERASDSSFGSRLRDLSSATPREPLWWLLLGRWEARFGTAASAQELFSQAASIYRERVDARPPDGEVPLEFVEALYRSGRLDEAEGWLRFLQDSSHSRQEWIGVMMVRLWLMRASQLLVPDRPEDALLVPGELDQLLLEHRAPPESVREARTLLGRARALLEHLGQSPTDRDLVRASRVPLWPSLSMLELLTRDPPRTVSDLRRAQFPIELTAALRAWDPISDPSTTPLVTGLELMRLMRELPPVDTTRLPETPRRAIARAQDHLRARFPGSPMLERACEVVPCLVLADLARSLLGSGKGRQPSESCLADRAVAGAGALLVLTTDFAAELPSSSSEEHSWAAARARLLLAHAHFASGNVERATRLALSALQQRPDDGVAHLALASLLMRQDHGANLLTLASTIVGHRACARSHDLMSSLVSPELAVARTHLEAVFSSPFLTDLPTLDLVLVDGLLLALQGKVDAARDALESFVTPRFLAERGFPGWVGEDQMRAVLALLGPSVK